MNILITGVNGFVGKALYNNLSASHTVYGIYNNNNKALLKNTFQLDLTNSTATTEFITKHATISIDVVIHLASKMANAQNLKDTNFVNDNLCITQNVCTLAKYYKVKHFINFSSSSVYPNIDGLFDENSIPDPSKNSDCLYGMSKLNGEILINYELAPIIRYITHLRIAMVHGEGMNEARIIPTLKKELNETNSLTLFGNGQRLINLINVDVLIKYISFFIENPISDIFNVVDECLTLLELATIMKATLGNEKTMINLVNKGNKFQFRLANSKLLSIIK